MSRPRRPDGKPWGSLHPLVRATLKAIPAFPADPQGLKRFRQIDCLPINLTDASTDWILHIYK